MTLSDKDRIDASVSKEFFVEMLIKDIPLEMALHDLLDNCIDGALRVRRDDRFDGLQVTITCSADYFEISDNCGGIAVETARHYAFCFGRPKKAPLVRYSVGRFGVGMKRAVFKLGKRFIVHSTTTTHRFIVDVDVSDWEQSADWLFEFSEVEECEEDLPADECGTSVRVEQLFDGVSDRFELESFIAKLMTGIASRYQTHLERGLVVSLNGVSIVGAPVEFFQTAGLQVGRSQEKYDGVLVRQLIGVGPRKPEDAGWYVFCNGRMVLQADQTEVTGWGEANIDRLPKYHNDFAWFRGCVLFDSEDSASLPWNTTKDGVDQDSSLYRSVRTRMVTMMHPVIQFLREVASEEEPEEPLRELLRSAVAVPLGTLQERGLVGTVGKDGSNAFWYRVPQPVVAPEDMATRIAYDRPVGVVNEVRKRLGVRSNKAVGEKTFEYYVRMEIDE